MARGGMSPGTNGDSSSPHKTGRMRERLAHGEAGNEPEYKWGQERSTQSKANARATGTGMYPVMPRRVWSTRCMAG